MTRKRIVIIVLLACLLTVCFFMFSGYGKVNVQIDSSLSATVYKRGQDGSYDNHRPVRQVATSSSFKLRRGQYTLVASGGGGFASVTEPFTVSRSDANLTVHPDYSRQKIEGLLLAEKPAILNSLKLFYPIPIRDYSIKNIYLYKRDTWAGASLSYQGKDIYDSDTLRVILHKVNGSWEIATNPPNISLSAQQYPQIPWDVLSATNNYL